MVLTQLQLSEKVAANVLLAAAAQGMTFSEYVEWQLSLALEEDSQVLEAVTPPQSADEIASEIHKFALEQPMLPISEEGDLESRPYLVEKLYKQMDFPMVWEDLGRGFRIQLGKAFKRVVDSSSGTLDEEARLAKKVVFFKLTQQNQSLYKTVRVG